VRIEALTRNRQYVFLGAFVVGMFLTPPDVISQTLLALPMYLLYEAGIMMCRILSRPAASHEPMRNKSA
jgi:sec-independent protein translocase protein TatC